MMEMFKDYDNLAFFNKYYFIDNNRFVIEDSFESILNKRQETNMLDTISLVELVNKNYMFGDRTLVKGICKSPWMSKPNEELNGWERKDIKISPNRNVSEKEIALNLLSLLEKEILEFCIDKNNVGILLSGGMDSRIIAGVLNRLVESKKLNINVIAITWGIEGSRDVVYAEKLARNLNWEWVHLDLSPKNLIENIEVTARLGCEFSPIHLHAMPRVRELKGLDCIIAASYGDSIGRARYSGKHVSKLKPINKKLINRYGIFKQGVFKEGLIEANKDIENYHKMYPQKNKIAEYELDLQYHYLRRQLNPCMAYINEKIPLYQAFTTPNIYKYIWSINPAFRNDNIYKYLLEKLDDKFSNIPWSKTGKIYMNNKQKADSFRKEHNMYGKWIRNDLHNYIVEKVLSTNIESLNIFNMEALEAMIITNKEKSNLMRHSRVDELLIWIASLSEAVALYSLKADVESIESSSRAKKLFHYLELNAYIYYKNIINKNE